MKHNTIYSLVFVLAMTLLTAGCRPALPADAPADTVAQSDEAARWQLLFAEYHRDFPAATLKDMYKYGFQDYFGPAHIVSDSLAGVRYVESEIRYLDSIGWRYNRHYEPLQLCGQYVRVNVLAVKEGCITTGRLVSALMRSGEHPDSSALAAWRALWPRVEQAIAPLADSLPDYAQDKAAIDSLLAAGRYVSHHSAAFNADNHYGYRLIRKDIFEAELLPYLAPQRP